MRFEITTVCTLTCTLSYTIPKTIDRLILPSEARDSPSSASTGETPSRKMSKVVAPRDAKRVFGRVGRQEEVRTSRRIIQRHTTRNIPLAHPSRPLMLPVQFPQGDDTGLRDGPDRHARTRPSSYLVPQTLRPEGTRHHHRHPPTRSHSRSHDSHRLLMVPRSLWSHTPHTTHRPRNTHDREPGLRHNQHEANPISSKHRLHANHPRQLLHTRPERQSIRQNHLVSARHLSREHSKWDWGIPPNQHSMPHLHPYRKPVPVPSWKQLHNNTHHPEKQPILLQHHPIDPNLSSNHQNLASKLLGNSSQTDHIPVVPKPTSRSAEGPTSCRTSRGH